MRLIRDQLQLVTKLLAPIFTLGTLLSPGCAAEPESYVTTWEEPGCNSQEHQVKTEVSRARLDLFRAENQADVLTFFQTGGIYQMHGRQFSATPVAEGLKVLREGVEVTAQLLPDGKGVQFRRPAGPRAGEVVGEVHLEPPNTEVAAYLAIEALSTATMIPSGQAKPNAAVLEFLIAATAITAIAALVICAALAPAKCHEKAVAECKGEDKVRDAKSDCGAAVKVKEGEFEVKTKCDVTCKP